MINHTAYHHLQEHCTPDTITRIVNPTHKCTQSQPQHYFEVNVHLPTLETLIARKETTDILRRKFVSPRGGPDVWEKKNVLPCWEKSGLLNRPACNLVTTLTELPPPQSKINLLRINTIKRKFRGLWPQSSNKPTASTSPGTLDFFKACFVLHRPVSRTVGRFRSRESVNMRLFCLSCPA